MLNTQAKGRVSNSAANSLPGLRKFHCRQLSENGSKRLISCQFSVSRACFWRLRCVSPCCQGNADGASHGGLPAPIVLAWVAGIDQQRPAHGSEVGARG